MRDSKWLLVCCLALTAVVVITAARIELLNIEGQQVLPRLAGSNSDSSKEWVIPEIEVVIERLDEQFYEQRMNAVGILSEESEDQPQQAQVKYGPPYSPLEQNFLASVTRLHAAHTNLLWWLKSFGRAQYFLAPAALVIAVLCAVSLSGWLKKSTAGMCAVLSIASIVLMFTRSYWESIGV